MPELPEVESTARYLNERIRNKQILEVDVYWERTVARPSVKEFRKDLKGRKVYGVFRRGKYVHIQLDKGWNLFIHLRMSGSLDVVSEKVPVAKHDRVVFHCTNGKTCRFNDTRKFGRMWLTKNIESVTGHLGVEPLDIALDKKLFFQMLRTKKTRIKALLLNQTFIAGIGNIYADEALWAAKIHPTTPANKIKEITAGRLLTAIKKILNEAIKHLGTDFGDGVVEGGMYQTKVYGRKGKLCKRCKTEISRILVAQRSTHFCKFCQKK